MVTLVGDLQKHNIPIRWVCLWLRRLLALFWIAEIFKIWVKSNSASNKWQFFLLPQEGVCPPVPEDTRSLFLSFLHVSKSIFLTALFPRMYQFDDCISVEMEHLELFPGGRGRETRRKADFTVYMSNVQLVKLAAWKSRLLNVFAFVIFNGDREQNIVSSWNGILWGCQKQPWQVGVSCNLVTWKRRELV